MYFRPDTQDMIRPPSREEATAYAATLAEYANIARALLATCRPLMTGLEIETCENATGDHDDDAGFDGEVIDRLANQFPKEIAAWINRRVQP